VSILQPRYGHGISSSDDPGVVQPATASLVTALLAKTTELSFVTVFVAFVGQVLTKHSLKLKSKGMTIAEMTMRNWVIQPGSLFTHWEGLRYAAITWLGVLTLLATISSIFYTTASDALVSPKLKFSNWNSQQLQGMVKTSYANPMFVVSTLLPFFPELSRQYCLLFHVNSANIVKPYRAKVVRLPLRQSLTRSMVDRRVWMSSTVDSHIGTSWNSWGRGKRLRVTRVPILKIKPTGPVGLLFFMTIRHSTQHGSRSLRGTWQRVL
jgi:hypothetical protein